MADSVSCRPEERLPQLLLRAGAAADGVLSEVHLLLRLRLRQGPLLRLGREGVRGDRFTCTEVTQHFKCTACQRTHESDKYLDQNTPEQTNELCWVFISSVVGSFTSTLNSSFLLFLADSLQRSIIMTSIRSFADLLFPASLTEIPQSN